ncbi:MAG TPA: Wzz/FepE/Etk N-terminal domain-containing protein, partial [Xanthomonadaceae bacterium]|nr:Wzz/FepE/Etk N-terminal domain-containing protein [Xanthomonadaceae bacterium]
MKSLTSRPSSDLAAHFPHEPPREGEVDLRSLFGTVFDHKRFLTIGIAAIFLASVAYVLMATPRYQASSLIKIERGAPSVPGQAPTGASSESARGSQAATEIPLLTSRTLFADAVRDLNLDVVATPQRFPLLGEYLARSFQPKRAGDVASPWFGLERYGWGGERLLVERMDVPATLQDQPLLLVAGAQGRYTLFDDDGNQLVQGRVGAPASGNGISMQVTELRANPGTHFDVLRRSPLAAVTDLAANVEASERGRDSGIISVTYENRDPEQAARVLDHITSAYVRQNVERNSAEAEKSLQFV